MELNFIESNAVEAASKSLQQSELGELNDAQLAIIGGGIADVIGA